MLDATGSMGSYIAQARARIRAIAKELATGTPTPDVRFALVAYRDHGEAFVTKITPFTADIEVMGKALDGTSAEGGGDTPESVLEGLDDAVRKLAWTPPADLGVVRLVYLVGDAPPKIYPDTPSEASIASEARARRIAIHGVVCGSGDSAVEPAFEAVARHTEGRIFRLDDGGRHRGGIDDGRGAASLASALTGATKAYSSSIGVSFDAGAPAVATTPLAVADGAVKTSGLRGGHARWVRNADTLADLWAAHVSLTPAAMRPPMPSVDFTKSHLLVLGGGGGNADERLALDGVVATSTGRAARVHAAKDGAGAGALERGVTFVLVPVATTEGGAQ